MVKDLDTEYRRLGLVTKLPGKILSLHGCENISEFVLHELCHEGCFNLKKAAYFIDNPDFDCLKGVVGHDKSQAYRPRQDIWGEMDAFTKHMQQAPFNKKVRSFVKPSFRRKGAPDSEIVEVVASSIGLKNPSFYAWNMKHDNHGILLYEKEESAPCDCEYLYECLCLLGFCPVF